MSESRVTIDGAALRHNLQRVRQCRPAAPILAMVKAEAYGHGAVAVAGILAAAGVDALGVAHLDEALALRAAGLRLPITLLEGLVGHEALDQVAEQRLHLVVHQAQQLHALLQWPGALARVWIKVNTGMNRLGFRPQEVAAVAQALHQRGGIAEIGLLTHLACADEAQDPQTDQQLQSFAECRRAVALEHASFANSALILTRPGPGHDWVRPGLMLYGASPLAERSAQELDLRPVMRLTSRVIAVQTLRAGDAVGYGATWRAARDGRIAIVGIGYGDGYPRTATAAPVALRGRRYRLAGRVSMDMLAIDVACDEVAVGDEVELWGGQIAVDTVAACAGTLSYELLCRLTQRALRHYE